MILSLGQAIAILAFCALIGKSFDILIRKKHKSKLHNKLTAAWWWLDHQKIGDLPQNVAKKIIRTLDLADQWILKKGFRLREVVIASVLTSFMLTYFAINAGKITLDTLEEEKDYPMEIELDSIESFYSIDYRDCDDYVDYLRSRSYNSYLSTHAHFRYLMRLDSIDLLVYRDSIESLDCFAYHKYNTYIDSLYSRSDDAYFSAQDLLEYLTKYEYTHPKSNHEYLKYLAFSDSLGFGDYLDSITLIRFASIENFSYIKRNIPETFSLNSVLLYFLNYLFDISTIIISLHILSLIATSHSSKILFLLIKDAIIAFLLAFSVYPTYLSIITSSSLVDSWKELFPFPISPMGNPDWSYILFSSTTLIPTVIILSTIFILLLAKYILIVSKNFGSYVLLRATDDEPEKLQIGTLTGTLFGVLAGIGKVIMAFV